MAGSDDEGDLWERRFTFSHGAVRIVEDWAGSVWDPSITLCRYIDSDELFPSGFWQGKRVLEVGSGCGLLGIYAAVLGAAVTLTDQPEVIPHLSRNVELNLDATARARVSVIPLSWGTSPLPASLLSPSLDFILAAECLYMGRVAPLLETLWAAASPETDVLVCGIVGEGTVESFLALVGKYFTVSVVPRMRRFGNSHDELPAARALYRLRKHPAST